ncbi:bacterial capsule synthesis PGA_cap family protein [Lyngbya aestuarii BL J]|uniref:Bacterial capsule synthesis PGA_cap family protein n=1 Tax=Lyngbya aestuarii BL J TaxID=1348334 RepID=U7QDB7_9CYAN|nr:CapA family protein [Lyngbya aestuarii]ERT05202.1 bacterial capsule synthesis PGA_cap family protein [Lyngbya aestuarii BL J]
MVYAEHLSQPSIFDLARSGDFQAINYLINSYLRPQGISARVGRERQGRLQVLIEFQTEPVAERIIKFICHLLWKLNSPTVEGVQIVGRYTGDPAVLWKQSVRIVTPANQVRRSPRSRTIESLKFRTFRTLLMMGSALSAFILGCWVSYYEVSAQLPQAPTPAQENVVSPTLPPKRPEQVQAALEVVPVVQQTTIQKPHDSTVTLMFGGDVTLSDHFETVVGDDHTWAFEKLDEYREVDVAMVNLENPLTRSTLRRPNKQFNFKADPEAVQVLTSGGVDLVNLANNHAMDYEAEGLIETLETLENSGIHAIGAGRDLTEARRPEILEVKGQRIAYFGYYDADFHAASEDSPGTNPRYDERVAADIQAVRDQVDWIIVNYHWGVELANYPGDWQIELARFTIDQGADLVVGHHPHVLQGAEIYQGRPIVYSLGNFIFGGNSRNDYDTAVLKVSLKADQKMKVEFLPVEVRQYQAKIVRGKKGDEILQNVERLSRIFDQPMNSPIVLDAPRSGLRTVKREPVTPVAPQLPNLSESTEQSVTPETLEDTGDDVEVPLTPPETVNLPPRLDAASSSSDSLKPYIHDPFIKDPFISIPQETPQPTSTSDSYNDSIGSISFALFKSEIETDDGPPAQTQVTVASDKGRVDLPPMVRRVQNSTVYD